jgi:hypothetical protein
MEDSAGETPTEAVGTTALPERAANLHNSHSDGRAKAVRRVGARGVWRCEVSGLMIRAVIRR